MPKATQLIANIQILRGLAALLVVLCHAVYSTRVADPGFTFGENLDHFGTVGVDLFFVISGFIIAHTAFVGQRREPLQFARQRIWRVVPLYFLLSLPWVGFAAMEGQLETGRLLATFAFWPATERINAPYLGVGWTLCFEMLFYAAATLCLRFPGWRMPVLLLLAYQLCWLGAIWTGAAPFVFLGNAIIVEFLLGVAIAYIARKPSLVAGAVALALGLLGLGASLVQGYGWIHSAPLIVDGSLSQQRLLVWGLPSALIVLGAALMPAWQLGALTRPLLMLGTASYSIYLIHPLALYGLETAVQMTRSALPSPLLYAVSIAVSLGAGLLVHRLIEQHLLQWGREARQHRRATPLESAG